MSTSRLVLEAAGIAELHYAKTPAKAVDLALSLATPRQGDARPAEREFRSQAAMSQAPADLVCLDPWSGPTFMGAMTAPGPGRGG